ncbi:uncharacterized protein LOC130730278 [Lotus japonicus]|uniref:uncharacterized protein LOC130730278 n=1 Tax=Lotus japonicus TaxID=34305 RepID=UPI0025889E75|nr:uncharacterized protein LOC130730278 [Lotus japonicus]
MAGVWVSWNVRGLGRAEKRKAIRLELDKLKPEVILLQETKLNEGREELLGGWIREKQLEACSILAVHAAGGLLTLWRKDKFRCDQVVRGDGFFLVVLSLINTEGVCVVCNVYGPHDSRERGHMFEELGLALEGRVGRVVFGGDFNAILNDGEKQGAGGDTLGDPSFKEFVSNQYLIDLPMLNGDHTWGSTRNEGLWSRLDRWLINEEALLGFDGVVQIAQDWGLSDHRAVVLN